MNYRKKPVVIQAEQFLGIDSPTDPADVGGVIQEAHIKRYSVSTDHCNSCDKPFAKHGSVETLEGEHIVCPGDFIIKGIAGEFYPCKSKIFYITYEAE